MLILFKLIPHHVEMLSSEIDGELHAKIIEIDPYRGVVETFDHRSFGYRQFSVAKREHVNVPGFEGHLVVDVDLVHLRVKLQACSVGALKVCVFYHDPQRTDPGYLLTLAVRDKEGVHVDFFVADQVECKPVFSLHGVAE